MAQPIKPASDRGAADRLRQQIDGGKTGDKVGVSDPAAAPLGTDSETADTDDEEGRRQARRAPPPGGERR